MEKDTAEKIVNKARKHLVEGGYLLKISLVQVNCIKLDKILVKLVLVLIVLIHYLMVVLKLEL
ncbi:MAG: hypothetical protein CM1200mP11_4550 [Nitrosopumilaceae archaeon]|nr:MAG: hypothetical protein CM1200mP11_4550 [Nitrosopumilaceae archaeon]